METRNDFEREIAHLRQVLEGLNSQNVGQQFQQKVSHAAEEFARSFTANQPKQSPQSGYRPPQNGQQNPSYGTQNQRAGQYQQYSSNNRQRDSQRSAQQPQYNNTYRQYNPPQSAPRQNPQSAPRQNPQPAPRVQTMPAVQRPACLPAKIPGKTASVLFRTFGLIGLIPTGSLMAILGMVQTFAVGDISTAMAVFGGFAPFVAAFGIMTGVGFGKAKDVKRCENYARLFAGKKMMNLEQLSQLTGRSKKYLVRDIRKMVRRGMLNGVYFDAQQTCVILDDETYHQYQILENRRKTLESTQTEATRIPAQSEENYDGVRGEGLKYIRQIRAANDALPGKEISDKLFRLETITVKIYEYIDKHPEKLEQVQKFMDYYMPTTTKLVQTYQEFEAQPVQGENILGAKREIEEMLNTISAAFENLLDGLFADNALDISSDISVMETMFKQDGLTKDDISGAAGSSAASR